MAITLSPFQWYGKGIQYLSLPGLLSDDIRLALCTSSYTPASTDEFFDVDITNELPTLYGYTAGGIALTTKVLTEDTPSGTFIFSSDVISITASGGDLTARYFVLYNNTPSSDKPLIGYSWLDYNSGTPRDVTVGDTYSLNITPTVGIFKTTIVNGSIA